MGGRLTQSSGERERAALPPLRVHRAPRQRLQTSSGPTPAPGPIQEDTTQARLDLRLPTRRRFPPEGTSPRVRAGGGIRGSAGSQLALGARVRRISMRPVAQNVDMADHSLTLMAVHAHPDDEAISTGGVLHKYGAEGIRTVLVTCTGGELGDGPGGLKPDQPGHDPEAVRLVRRSELEESCRQLGISQLEMLGYRDSGMTEWDRAGTAGAFASTELDLEVARLAEMLQRYHPQVVVSYGEDGGYGHPDHVRAHQVARGAVIASGIPSKFYYTVFPKSLARRVIDQMKAAGIDPWDLGAMDFDPDDPPFGVADDLITTVVDVMADVPAKWAAVRSHRSQKDNDFFADLPEPVAPMIMGTEYYIRAIDHSGAPLPETDLFAGLR